MIIRDRGRLIVLITQFVDPLPRRTRVCADRMNRRPNAGGTMRQSRGERSVYPLS